MTLAPDDPRHGTTTGYRAHRCRCDRCRSALADYMREYRHRTGRSKRYYDQPAYLTDQATAELTAQIDAIATPLAMYALAWLMSEGAA